MVAAVADIVLLVVMQVAADVVILIVMQVAAYSVPLVVMQMKATAAADIVLLGSMQVLKVAEWRMLMPPRQLKNLVQAILMAQ